jgi:paraquat-inducible protein B
MAEEISEKTIPSDLPEAVVRTGKHFSIVWVVPFVALLIGAWLAYRAVSETGPTVTITFNTAEGLEAGKTKIKYKDVEVGQVASIDLSKDLTRVVVTAKLVKGAEDYLTEHTRFWVVRARVAAGEVSGLGTIFSGAYIGLDPGKKGKPARTFEGLEVPPVLTAGLPGGHFLLIADRLGSLDVGSPVYYRQIKVGQVVAYSLEKDGKAVAIKVFIAAPHHHRVHKNTRFWNVSGLDIAVDANGVRVDAESFVTMIIGGVAFDTPENLEPAGPAEDGDVFRLYEKHADVYEMTYTEKAHYVMYFSGSVRGLSRGAPVEFRGIKIGEVTDVTLEYDESRLEVRIPVVIAIETERIAYVGEPSSGDKENRLEALVEKGLRAQLKTGSLLTGQLLVDLDFHPEAPPAHILHGGKYPEIPTVPRPFEEIATRVAHLVDKLEKLPLEEIGRDLRSTVRGTEQFVNSPALRESIDALKKTLEQTQQLTTNLNAEVAPEMKDSLEQLRKTLTAAESLVGQDSALQYELKKTLEELGHAARAVRSMADYLERHPEALLRGKGSEQ